MYMLALLLPGSNFILLLLVYLLHIFSKSTQVNLQTPFVHILAWPYHEVPGGYRQVAVWDMWKAEIFICTFLTSLSRRWEGIYLFLLRWRWIYTPKQIQWEIHIRSASFVCFVKWQLCMQIIPLGFQRKYWWFK